MKLSNVLAGVCLVVTLLALAWAQQDHDRRRFDNAEQWAKIFDDPSRDSWQKPDEVIRALALAPDATVADIGAGTGYFAVRIARAVPRGRVIGVDIAPGMVRYLDERARREGLGNVSAQLGGSDEPRLAAAVDLAIVVDTYHHIPARANYFRRVREALKPGGRLAIIDYLAASPIGPPAPHRIPPERVREELGSAGFELLQEHRFLPYQYFLVLRPAVR